MADGISREEYKEILDGEEILSQHFEGCVGVRGDEIIRAGKVIAKLTKRNAKILFDELLDAEGL